MQPFEQTKLLKGSVTITLPQISKGSALETSADAQKEVLEPKLKVIYSKRFLFRQQWRTSDSQITHSDLYGCLLLN